MTEIPSCFNSDCVVKEPAPQAKDDEAAKRLWELSEEMTKLVKK